MEIGEKMNRNYRKNSLKGKTFSRNEVDVKLPDEVNYKDISICRVETKTGRNNACLLDKSTIFYYVIEGNGQFIVNDEKVDVATNDLIEILPQNKYTYQGNLKMLEILSSRFDEEEVHEF